MINRRMFFRLLSLVQAVLFLLSIPDLRAQRVSWERIEMREVGEALDVPGCQQSPYLTQIGDFPNRKSLKLQVLFNESTEMFRGNKRTAITVTHKATANAEWVKNLVVQMASAEVPKDSCDAISLGAFSFSAPGDGPFVGAVDLDYQGLCCPGVTCDNGVNCN